MFPGTLFQWGFPKSNGLLGVWISNLLGTAKMEGIDEGHS